MIKKNKQTNNQNKWSTFRTVKLVIAIYESEMVIKHVPVPKQQQPIFDMWKGHS